MGNGTNYRRIWSGYRTGQRINRVSLEAEAWFWRILAVTDHLGCVPADIAILQELTTGLRTVKRVQVRKWVSELVSVGLLEYTDQLLHVIDFTELQSKSILNGDRAHISDQIRRDVLSVGYCNYCGTDENLSVDHKIPVSRGGTDDRSNLQCLCLPCNIRKSNKLESDADLEGYLD